MIWQGRGRGQEAARSVRNLEGGVGQGVDAGREKVIDIPETGEPDNLGYGLSNRGGDPAPSIHRVDGPEWHGALVCHKRVDTHLSKRKVAPTDGCTPLGGLEVRLHEEDTVLRERSDSRNMNIS